MSNPLRSRSRSSAPAGFVSYIPGLSGLALLAALALAGGSSHADAPAQLVVRLVAVGAIGLVIVFGDLRSLARARLPLILLGCAVALAVAHLVPLPFGLWSILPGRSFVLGADALAGVQQPWRPLSLDPDRTLNALVALLPPVAALLAAATMRSRDLQRGFIAIAILAALSAVVAMLQLGGVGGGRLYYYDLASMGDATGLFPNRNHNAALLICGMLVVAHLTAASRFAPLRLAVIGFLGVAVMLTQSRSGMIIGVIALALSYRALLRLVRTVQGGGRQRQIQGRWPTYAVIAVPLVLVGLGAFAAARSGSFARFLKVTDGDSRFDILGTVTDLAWHYFPVGSGLGTFDAVFRIAESQSSLRPEYFNHAHNDLLETVITAGLPGLVLMAVFVVWLAGAVRRAWRSDNQFWAAALCVLVLLGQSLVDYPLRTPLLASVFVLALVWMCRLPTVLYPDGRDD